MHTADPTITAIREAAAGDRPLVLLTTQDLHAALSLFPHDRHAALRTWDMTCRRGLPSTKVRDLLANLVADLDDLGL